MTLFDDDLFIESGVTSGADPSNWDPIRIDGEDQNEGDDGVKTDQAADSQPAGVTSGSDVIDDNVKSSQRKNKKHK